MILLVSVSHIIKNTLYWRYEDHRFLKRQHHLEELADATLADLQLLGFDQRLLAQRMLRLVPWLLFSVDQVLLMNKNCQFFPRYALDMFEFIDTRDWGSKNLQIRQLNLPPMNSWGFLVDPSQWSLLHSYKAVCQYMPGFMRKWLIVSSGLMFLCRQAFPAKFMIRTKEWLWNMVLHVDILLHIRSAQNLYNDKMFQKKYRNK